MPTYDRNFRRSGIFAQGRFSRTVRLIVALACALFTGVPAFAETPVVDARAPDFTLSTPTGKAVRMSADLRGHVLVLVVLRGFPAISALLCETGL